MCWNVGQGLSVQRLCGTEGVATAASGVPGGIDLDLSGFSPDMTIQGLHLKPEPPGIHGSIGLNEGGRPDLEQCRKESFPGHLLHRV